MPSDWELQEPILQRQASREAAAGRPLALLPIERCPAISTVAQAKESSRGRRQTLIAIIADPSSSAYFRVVSETFRVPQLILPTLQCRVDSGPPSAAGRSLRGVEATAGHQHTSLRFGTRCRRQASSSTQAGQLSHSSRANC